MADFFEHSTATRALVDGSFLDVDEELDIAYNKVRLIEPLISRDIFNAVNSLGNELIGTQFAVKTASSVNDKVERVRHKMQNGNTHHTLPEIFSQIKDLVRYTEICPHDDIIKTAEATIKKLEESGFILSGYKNYFLEPYPQTGYQGLHLNFISPYGQEIELQVHSKESFETKQQGHELYEKVRSVASQEKDKDEMIAEMLDLHSKTPKPNGYDAFCPIKRNAHEIPSKWSMSEEEKAQIRRDREKGIDIQIQTDYNINIGIVRVFDISVNGHAALHGFENVYSDGSARTYQNFLENGRAKYISVDNNGDKIRIQEAKQRIFSLDDAIMIADAAEKTNKKYEELVLAEATFEELRDWAEAIIFCDNEREIHGRNQEPDGQIQGHS